MTNLWLLAVSLPNGLKNDPLNIIFVCDSSSQCLWSASQASRTYFCPDNTITDRCMSDRHCINLHSQTAVWFMFSLLSYFIIITLPFKALWPENRTADHLLNIMHDFFFFFLVFVFFVQIIWKHWFVFLLDITVVNTIYLMTITNADLYLLKGNKPGNLSVGEIELNVSQKQTPWKKIISQAHFSGPLTMKR